MKASDFNMPEDIRFDFNSGITTFRDSRLLIYDANAIGLMRQELINLVGIEKAREFFVKFNYQNGYEEFMNMKNNYTFDNEMELLASGPTIHTWRGIVKANPKELRFNRESGEFYFSGVWDNSYEAEQHLEFNGQSADPVCWSLVGYASGWASAFFGQKLITIEPVCKGKGDNHCEWLVKPPADWGDEAKLYIDILKEF
ncbi:MAG: XylR N-terminal domain-containing protein [Ignavibacteria bacterium]